MNFDKLFKKIETTHIIILIAAVALGYAIYTYSTKKGSVFDGMNGGDSMPMTVDGLDHASQNANNGALQPSEQLSGVPTPASVSDIQTTQPIPNVAGIVRQQAIDPAELLPRDDNSEWAKMNPMGSGDLQNVNLLQAGHHIGINTVSSSLRNANLQLRSEPPNPQLPVGPWNQTTIQPDLGRRPLEIGSSA